MAGVDDHRSGHGRLFFFRHGLPGCLLYTPGEQKAQPGKKKHPKNGLHTDFFHAFRLLFHDIQSFQCMREPFLLRTKTGSLRAEPVF